MSRTIDRLEFALSLADEADRIAMGWFRGGPRVERKADGTLVTAADREVEAALRARIRAAFPGEAILGEEEGASGGWTAGRWILDPIDGTHNFARGIPVFAALIAWEEGGAVEVGVASAPALGTRWWAARGEGAWRAARPSRGRSGDRIRASGIAALADAQVLTAEGPATEARWPGAAALARGAWRHRGFGDFWGHCLVAEGAAEAMLDPAVHPYDVAALIPIAEEAGGRITSDAGGPVLPAGHAVTTNGLLHDLVLGGLRRG